MGEAKPKIALWFRYGPAEHAELFHAMPGIIERLARECEVHYFGFRSPKPIPDAIRANAVVHDLGLTVDRTHHRDKHVKAVLWFLLLPLVALRCRFLGIHAVYFDDSTPLSALTARLLSGARVAYTVADFYTDIYFDRLPLLRPLGRAIRGLDVAAWRRTPLLFTRTTSAAEYLEGVGVPADRVRPVYDPCDFSLYHPGDRAAARRHYGFDETHIVLVHHGILHPNKGNDFILRALAPLTKEHSGLRYLLVGDGPDMARLRHLTRELNLEDKVLFTGWLPRPQDVGAALNAGDIGLVMRVGHETDHFHLTGALVHSMACGLPILAANLAGVAEAVHEGDAGLLFDPRDPESFRAKLLQFIRDPGLRRRCGLRAHELARELFDMNRVIEDTVRPLVDLARAGQERRAS